MTSSTMVCLNSDHTSNSLCSNSATSLVRWVLLHPILKTASNLVIYWVQVGLVRLPEVERWILVWVGADIQQWQMHDERWDNTIVVLFFDTPCMSISPIPRSSQSLRKKLKLQWSSRNDWWLCKSVTKKCTGWFFSPPCFTHTEQHYKLRPLWIGVDCCLP